MKDVVVIVDVVKTPGRGINKSTVTMFSPAEMLDNGFRLETIGAVTNVVRGDDTYIELNMYKSNVTMNVGFITFDQDVNVLSVIVNESVLDRDMKISKKNVDGPVIVKFSRSDILDIPVITQLLSPNKPSNKGSNDQSQFGFDFDKIFNNSDIKNMFGAPKPILQNGTAIVIDFDIKTLNKVINVNMDPSNPSCPVGSAGYYNTNPFVSKKMEFKDYYLFVPEECFKISTYKYILSLIGDHVTINNNFLENIKLIISDDVYEILVNDSMITPNCFKLIDYRSSVIVDIGNTASLCNSVDLPYSTWTRVITTTNGSLDTMCDVEEKVLFSKRYKDIKSRRIKDLVNEAIEYSSKNSLNKNTLVKVWFTKDLVNTDKELMDEFEDVNVKGSIYGVQEHIKEELNEK